MKTAWNVAVLEKTHSNTSYVFFFQMAALVRVGLNLKWITKNKITTSVPEITNNNGCHNDYFLGLLIYIIKEHQQQTY